MTSPLSKARRTALAALTAGAALISPLMTAAPSHALTWNERILGADELAATRVGLTPYVWGGTDFYRGADCSGFTQATYALRGVALPRTAAQQRGATTRISSTSAQPGDLVFFHGGSTSSTSNVYHVGIYDGGGYIIDASSSGRRVVHRKIWTSSVSYGTRRDLSATAAVPATGDVRATWPATPPQVRTNPS